MSGMSVSATNRPPNSPKWPRSSGPVRNELGCATFIGGSQSGDRCRRSARRANEIADLAEILFAGRTFDPRRDVHAGRAGDAQSFGDVVRIEPAGEHVGNRKIKLFQQMPV